MVPSWNSQRFFHAISRVTALLLIISAVGAWAFFSYENRLTTLDLDPIQSSADKDINVILLVIDTLRSDHLGCYGYSRPTSPCMDSLARDEIFFKNSYSHTSWTKPSVATILTSLYPSVHT
ncbi:MAG: sulfatase-like hydrolase/transferase, partial [Elusimicrobia bacterium]|nr:sulfatase-like hydrolase/transferase [Elusimicrobiota bacterium]MBD3412742.1 sulfatase-like hydrolase/transferase [Elusimicrobiota bacterium]